MFCKIIIACFRQRASALPIPSLTNLCAGVFIFASAMGFSMSSALAIELGPPAQVNPTFSSDEDILEFRVASDAEHVLYSIQSSSPFNGRVYVADLDGSTTDFTNVTGSRYRRNVAISPDGKTMVITTSSNSATSASQMFSRPMDLSAGQTFLIPTLGGGKEVSTIGFSPDNARVVFTSEETTNNLREVWSVPIEGPASSRVKLSGPMDAPSGSTITGAVIVGVSADSSTVVYRAQQSSDTVPELYSVAIDGSSPPVKLTDLSAAAHVSSLRDEIISADGMTVLFIVDLATDGIFELYAVPTAGPNTSLTKLNHDLAGGTTNDFRLSQDGSSVVYRALSASSVAELYSVPVDRATEPVKISPTPVENGDVSSTYEITSDGSRVVFEGDIDINSTTEVFSVPISGPPASAVKLHADLVDGQDAKELALSNDGSTAVFLLDLDLPEADEDLYRAPIDGSQPAVQLNPQMVANGRFETFKISPDSTYVIYTASQETQSIDEIYVVPLDASEVARKLHDPLPPSAEVDRRDFLITPDSNRVVFIAELFEEDKMELFSVTRRSAGNELCSVVKAKTGGVVVFCL